MYINTVGEGSQHVRFAQVAHSLLWVIAKYHFLIGFAVISCAGFNSATPSDLRITSKRNK